MSIFDSALGSAAGSLGGILSGGGVLGGVLGGHGVLPPPPQQEPQQDMGMQTQSGEDFYPQNLAGLLQMIGGNQANPANMNLIRGGLI